MICRKLLVGIDARAWEEYRVMLLERPIMGTYRCGWVVVLTALLATGGSARPAEDNTVEGLVELIKQVQAMRTEGRSREAVPLAKRVAAAAPQVAGADSEATAACLNLAGLVCYEAGEYARAEPLYRRSLEIWEAKLGKDHRRWNP
jgi:hypothetical protein